MTPREFWSSADPLARSALVIAAIAVLVHVATFTRLSLNGVGLITIVIHLAVAIVFAAVSLRTSRWMNAVARRRVASADRRQVPRWLTVLAVSAVVYAVAPFAFFFRFAFQPSTGQTIDIPDDFMFRGMSSMSIALAINACAFAYRLPKDLPKPPERVDAGAQTHDERAPAGNEAVQSCVSAGTLKSPTFLGWPVQVVILLAVTAAVSLAMVRTAETEFGLNVAATIATACVITLWLRYQYLFMRPLYGRHIALAVVAVAIVAFVAVQIRLYLQPDSVGRLRWLVIGARVAPWVAFGALAIVGAVAMLRAAQRASRKW